MMEMATGEIARAEELEHFLLRDVRTKERAFETYRQTRSNTIATYEMLVVQLRELASTSLLVKHSGNDFWDYLDRLAQRKKGMHFSVTEAVYQVLREQDIESAEDPVIPERSKLVISWIFDRHKVLLRLPEEHHVLEKGIRELSATLDPT